MVGRMGGAVAAALLGVTVLAPPVRAAEITGSGTVTYVGRHIGDRPTAGGTGLGHDHLKGVILADDPENPMHMVEHDCLAGSLLGPEGDTGDGAGYCDGIDADGDVFLLWYSNRGDDRHWSFIGGTGKWDGVSGGGTTKVVGFTPDGRIVVTWEGRWTMAAP